MSRIVKLGLYIVCLIGIFGFGSLALRAYREASKSSERSKERLNQLTSSESAPAAADTNAAPHAPETNTNAAPLPDAGNTAVTNEPDPGTNTAAAAPAPDATNSTPTNAATAAPSRRPEAGETAGTSSRGYTKMVTYGLVTVLSLIGLAVLIAYDASQFVARRAESILFSNEGQPTDPEYEKAEQLWADAKYLEAVRAMRDYLNKNPREQYVALRIAEIYEENLNNPLAAALEYEEVLTKKLPAERWGWAAIHLANIYSGKLNKPDQSIAMLRRIDAEYGQTAAAKKARERLLQIDPDFVPTPPPEMETEAGESEPDATDSARPETNLPPGFRPKG